MSGLFVSVNNAIAAAKVAIYAVFAGIAGSSFVGFIQSGLGAVLRTIQEELRAKISVKQFGAVGDDETDDAAAFRAAIVAASSAGIGKIHVPPGVYLLGTRVVEGTTLPNGIEFVAEGARAGGLNYLEDKTILKFTAANAYLFDIRNPNGGGERGNWRFKNIAFQATQATSGIFSLNYLNQAGATYIPTDDGTTPDYVLNVNFENCRFWGAQGGAAQSGDAIRACKTFDLIVDADCNFRGWRTGVYGVGCDNADIAGKYAGNGRHIRLESSGNFGNDGLINHPICGDCSTTADGTAAEQGFPLYLSMRSVVVQTPGLEPATAKALMYIAGLKTTVYSPMFTTGIPIYQLSSGAKNTAIYDARAGGAVTAPIYSAAESWDFGGTGYDYSVSMIAPGPFVYGALKPHPRLRIINSTNLTHYNAMHGPSNFLLDANGPRQKQIAMTAFDYFGRSAGYGFSEVELIADDNAYFGTGAAASDTGFAIRLPAASGGFGIRLQAGKHLQNGDTVKFTVWYRGAGDPTFALRLSVLKNGSGLIQSDPVFSANYTKAAISFTAACVLDDEYVVQAFNAGGNQAAYISAVLVEIVDAANADTSGLTVGQLETEVNELKATMRKFGLIA